MRFLFKSRLTGQTYPDDLFFFEDESKKGDESFFHTMKNIDENYEIYLCDKLDLQ